MCSSSWRRTVLFDGSIWPPSSMRPMRDLENLRCTVEKDNGSFKMFQDVSRCFKMFQELILFPLMPWMRRDLNRIFRWVEPNRLYNGYTMLYISWCPLTFAITSLNSCHFHTPWSCSTFADLRRHDPKALPILLQQMQKLFV